MDMMEARNRGKHAVLYLDGKAVGEVIIKGGDMSWGFGDFQPREEFGTFATVFGHWSLLMHSDGEEGRLSPAVIEELSQAEVMLDQLKARLFFPNEQEWVNVAQLTIDGELLEWKEY
jgi:hypothetical protein